MVGWIRAHLGQHEAALRHCRVALDLHRESGSRTGVADTLDSIAYIYGQLGDYRQAIAHYEQALAMYRQIGDPEGEASSLLHLGDVQLAAGLRGGGPAQLGAGAGAARRRSPAPTRARRRRPGQPSSSRTPPRPAPEPCKCGNVAESWNVRPRAGAVKLRCAVS